MSIANPLWGAPRIHGELLKLGIDVGQTSVAISFRLLYGFLIMGTADDKFYGLASQLILLQNGSQIRSRKHAGGNRFPAISFVTGTGPM